jgi:hypothetical protein
MSPEASPQEIMILIGAGSLVMEFRER